MGVKPEWLLPDRNVIHDVAHSLDFFGNVTGLFLFIGRLDQAAQSGNAVGHHNGYALKLGLVPSTFLSRAEVAAASMGPGAGCWAFDGTVVADCWDRCPGFG